MPSRAPSAIDQAIRAFALPQLGLVTLRQLETVGIGESAVRRRLSTGMLCRVFTGVYRLTGYQPPAHQQALAAALAVPGSCIAGPTAAQVHGFPLPRPDEWCSKPLVRVASSAVVRVSGIQVVRTNVELPSRRWMSVSLSTPAATLLLLPRFVHGSTVERCLDHCIAHRLVAVAGVRALIERQPPTSVAGRSMLLSLLDQRGDRVGHRSKLEQRVARWLRQVGLRGWSSNYVVTTPEGPIEVDYAWVEDQVALEVSPFFTHGSRTKQARDIARRRALVDAGWRVVEASDRDLQSPATFANVIRSLQDLLGVRSISVAQR